MFKTAELLKATKGKLVTGSSSKDVCGISIDTRMIRPGEAFVAVKGNNFDGHDFIETALKKQAGCIIASSLLPSADKLKVPVIKVKDTVKALGDIACFHRKRFDVPVIAVTGSNGKTTTKEMIWQVLSSRYTVLKNEGSKNNAIGLPMALLGLRAGHDMAVLEIGTNHFGEVGYLADICLPNIGVITNVGPSHLEFLRDLEGVFAEKYSLLNRLLPPRIGILNRDDRLLAKKAAGAGQRPFIVSVGLKGAADFRAVAVRLNGDTIDFRLREKYKFTLNTAGDYNIYNALSAIALARLFGIGYDQIKRSLSGFTFPRSRLNLIVLRNIRFIDDSYNSNPLSLKKALAVLSQFKVRGRRIFVMGDMLELGKEKKFLHRQAASDILDACDVFISVGELAKFTAQALLARGFRRKNVFSCGSALEARDILQGILPLGRDDIVLVKGSRAMKMETIIEKFRS